MTSLITQSSARIRTRRVRDLLGELDLLTGENREPGRRLSIYLPAGRMPEDAEKARIRFRNAVGTLRERLSEEGGRSSEIESFLREVEEFAHGKEEDAEFWNNQLGGLAILCDPDGIRLFEVPKRFRPAMYFSTHWYLTPLLELAANVNSYWLVSLSQNDVRFYRGSRLGLREVDLPNAPRSFSESEMQTAQGHGHDPDQVQPSADRDALRRFFAKIDRSVFEIVGGSGAPVILAGVEYYLPLYEEVTRLRNLSGEIIAGNPEHLSRDELHRRATEALGGEFQQSRKRELMRISRLMEQDRVETGVEAVLRAAHEGRIASLVAPSDAVCWGTYDWESQEIEKLPGTDIRGRDLYQQAAEATLLYGGELFYLESIKMPGGYDICAKLRS